MSTVTAPLRLRLPLDVSKFSAIQCLFQSAVPKFPRGQPLDVEVGIYQYNTWVDSLANYVSINMSIHPSINRAGSTLVTKPVLVAAMATPSEAQWLAGTHQHAKFSLSSAETNFDLTGSTDNQLGFWMVFWAVLSDGNTPTLGYTQPTVIESAAALSLGSIGASQPNHIVTTRQLLCVKGKTMGGAFPLTVDDTVSPPVLTIGDELTS